MSKSCLVLDLDNTLIETFGNISTWDYVDGETSKRKQDRLFTIDVNDNFLWGTKRPHLEHFFETANKTFDMVGVWSAGTKPYVHEVVHELFFPGWPVFVWSRDDCESCLKDGESVLQKPLAKLFKKYPQIDPKRTIIIDDYEDVCEQNTLYHVHIPAWKGGKNTLVESDARLKELANWFEKDVKTAKDFKLLSYKEIFKW